jgi:hypothetical protein
MLRSLTELAMGENDLGFEWLKTGYEQRDGAMVFFGVLSEKIYRQSTFKRTRGWLTC